MRWETGPAELCIRHQAGFKLLRFPANQRCSPVSTGDNMQHMYYPERDCHQALNSGYKTTR